MKKTFLAFCFAVFAVCAVSAGDKGCPFIIKDGASLWSLKGKTMTWVSNLSLGQQMVSASNGTSKGSYKGADYELVKVKTDTNEEGYVIASLIARNAKTLAVVTNPLAAIYSQPRDAAVTSTILPVMNIVAVWEVPGKSDFYQIACYAQDSGTYISDKYVLASDVSVSDADINTALLLQTVKGLAKKEQKQKTLQVLTKKYPSSAFSAQVSELSAAFTPETIPMEDFQATLSATDTVNIRDIPSVYGGVVVTVKKGDKVTAVQKTAASYTIDGKAGKWVKVSGPKEGWVFDAYFAAN